MPNPNCPPPDRRSPDPLTLIADAGECMLAAGAEVARVEDTMERLAAALGVSGAAVVLPTVLLFSGADGRTLMRRVRRRGTNLGVVAAINDLSREATGGNLTVQQLADGLRATAQYRRYPLVVDLVAAGGAAALLSQIFLGTTRDLPWAFLAGLLAQAVRARVRGTPFEGSLGDFLAAALASVPALAAAALGVPHPASIVAGGVMVLVPGLMITTAVRDGLAGDSLSAAARLLEAVMVAGAVAAGAAVPLYLYLQLGGHFG